MEAASHHQHDHERENRHDHHGPLPTSGRALDAVAISATLHCLTGCAIGEVTGMVLGTWWGFSDWGTVALAVALAFLFGYTLTSLPLLRAGLALGTVIPIAFASDTLSIATMEVVDNVIMLAVPGAMEAGLDNLLFWGSLSVALVIAGAVAFPVNRWLLARGKGHAAVHATGIHGGPPIRVVAIAAAAAAVFGTVVLVAEAFEGDSGGHGGGHAAGAGSQEQVRGLAVIDRGLRLELDRAELPLGRRTQLAFRIIDADGKPVRDFEVEHDQRLHLIFVRRDMTGFQHLHPKLDGAGTWRSPITVRDAGGYRVFADFKRDGENYTPASDLAVDGEVDWRELPKPASTADAGAGYTVHLDGGTARAGTETELRFTVTREGREVPVEDYLGAKGHLVALRQGDLAYLHVHPSEQEPSGDHGAADHGGGAGHPISFATEFPNDGRYRLFLQFKHQGRVHTAAFTQDVSR